MTRYASSAVAYNALMHHRRFPSVMTEGGAVMRLPQDRAWRKLYRSILSEYRTALADGAPVMESLSAAHEAANNPTYIPALLAGDVLRQLPSPNSLNPELMKPSAEHIVSVVWKYWAEHPTGCGSVPLRELDILLDPYWK